MKDDFEIAVKVRIRRAGAADAYAFSQGGAELLRKIDEYRSISRAAKQMKMAFSNAWKSINALEAHFGVQLVSRSVPAGSSLTEQGTKLIECHDKAKAAATAAANSVLQDLQL